MYILLIVYLLIRILIIGILSRFFCPISKTSPLIAKTNFQITLVQGILIRIWCQGFHPLCGVRRSPDWLISRPLRWLSCRHYSHSLLSTIRFAGSLDVPESRQIKTFVCLSLRQSIGIIYSTFNMIYSYSELIAQSLRVYSCPVSYTHLTLPTKA